MNINPKLLSVLKDISRETGVEVNDLINLAVYELARRLGHITPNVQHMPVMEASNVVLKQPEPAVLSKRKIGPSVTVRPKASADAAGGEVLHFQLDDGPYVPIRKNVFLIGRGSKCDCVLKHRGASREHAVVTRERSGWYIEDLDSANGTWLNGQQITKHKIAPGDEIQISDHLIRLTIRQS